MNATCSFDNDPLIPAGIAKKPKRIRCPICKRRFVVRVTVMADGNKVFLLPPHKPKEWYKKKIPK